MLRALYGVCGKSSWNIAQRLRRYFPPISRMKAPFKSARSRIKYLRNRGTVSPPAVPESPESVSHFRSHEKHPPRRESIPRDHTASPPTLLHLFHQPDANTLSVFITFRLVSCGLGAWGGGPLKNVAVVAALEGYLGTLEGEAAGTTRIPWWGLVIEGRLWWREMLVMGWTGLMG